MPVIFRLITPDKKMSFWAWKKTSYDFCKGRSFYDFRDMDKEALTASEFYKTQVPLKMSEQIKNLPLA